MGFWSDVGDAVSSAVSTVGDVVEDTVSAVVDTVEDAVDAVVDTAQDGIQASNEWLCDKAGDFGCAVGNVIGGAIDGLLKGVQDLLHDGFKIAKNLGGVVGSVLRLDLPGLLEDLGALVVNVVDLVIDAGRFVTGGYIVGGIVGHFKDAALRNFVADLVAARFGDNPDQLAEVRRKIGLDGGRFGFRLPAQHRVFVMDSDQVPLWRMHNDGIIDLYAMAGLLSFSSFTLGGAHPNTVVKSVDSAGNDNFWPVTRWTISKYLESQGRDRRLRLYAMSRPVIANMLGTASRKLKEIGVILEWNDGTNFPWFRDYTRQKITELVYDFNSEQIESLLACPEYERSPGVNCNLLALAAFKLERFGRVAGRHILDCDKFPADCATPGRTDLCCVTVRHRASSGVIYRDTYLTDFFQYVLAHEIGHYLGLCHCGHDGFQNIMFTMKENSLFDWGLFSFYWESDPHFSLENGKNAWRFIVDQLTTCLTGEREPSPVHLEAEKKVVSSVDSCAV
jgi:hypothetical protein